ncbi:unnamed protein product, partial [Oppiella nova]
SSFERLYNNKDFNDCRFIVGTKHIFASKAVLSSHSEVFQQMFSTDMSEKESNEVIIDDIECEKSDKLEEMAEQLLYVSDKYMVSDLKKICMNLVFMKINKRNAFKVLKAMDKYGSEELRAKTIEFIEENMSQTLEEEWVNILGNDRPLIDVLVFALKNNWRPKMPTKTMTYTYSYIGSQEILEAQSSNVESRSHFSHHLAQYVRFLLIY